MVWACYLKAPQQIVSRILFAGRTRRMALHLSDLPGSDATEVARDGPSLLPYLVLLRVGFTLPRLSPALR